MSWLTVPVLLASLASAYDGKGEDTVVGAGAPWGIPTDVFQQALTRQGCTVYRPIQLEQAHVVLKNLLARPEDFEAHMRR